MDRKLLDSNFYRVGWTRSTPSVLNLSFCGEEKTELDLGGRKPRLLLLQRRRSYIKKAEKKETAVRWGLLVGWLEDLW